MQGKKNSGPSCAAAALPHLHMPGSGATSQLYALARPDHHARADQQRPPRRSRHTASSFAQRLDRDTPAHNRESLSVRGSLLLRGAIAAAQRSDRATAHELLAEAEETGHRLGADANLRWTAFGPTNVTLHHVHIAVTLGDAGTPSTPPASCGNHPQLALAGTVGIWPALPLVRDEEARVNGDKLSLTPYRDNVTLSIWRR